MKIVFLDADTLGDTSLDPIARLGELVCYAGSSHGEALERVSDCEVLITNKVVIDREIIDAAPGLRLICEAATGVNNIDIAYAEEKGIKVKNVAGYSTDSVAQLTFTHILSLTGHCAYFDGSVKSGRYSRSGIFTDVSKSFRELSGKTIGIVGMGAIGRKVASIAEAFGMKVIYFSTSGTSHCNEYQSVGIEDLMRDSDIVSIHAPLNGRTRGLIGERELSLMKPDALIVNMGRGGIVDEKALAEAVEQGRIAGAAADVFTQEPLPEDNPLMKISRKERLSLSPHIGWASAEARKRLVDGIAANISAG